MSSFFDNIREKGGCRNSLQKPFIKQVKLISFLLLVDMEPDYICFLLFLQKKLRFLQKNKENFQEYDKIEVL